MRADYLVDYAGKAHHTRLEAIEWTSLFCCCTCHYINIYIFIWKRVCLSPAGVDNFQLKTILIIQRIKVNIWLCVYFSTLFFTVQFSFFFFSFLVHFIFFIYFVHIIWKAEKIDTAFSCHCVVLIAS